MKTGVVGFGVAAQFMHLPFITTNPDYELYSILQRKGDSAKEKYPSAKIVRSIDEMLADPALELVVITTPNDTHFDYTARALRAGRHVVLEKPFTITSEEAKKLIAIAKESGKVLSVFQNRRYVSDFLTIRQLLNENMLGEVVEFEAHYDRYRPEQRPNAWREENAQGSGILYDDRSPEALLAGARRAVAAFNRGLPFERLRTRIMRADLSWERSARAFELVYMQAADIQAA